MTSQENEPKSSSSGGWLWLALLPVLYVLSLGPVVKVCLLYGINTGGKVGGAIDLFYSPLKWLRDNTFLREPLDAYINFWVSL